VNRHKIYAIAIVLLAAFLLSGCGDQRILEKIGFTHTTSYDLAPKKEGQTEDELIISISIPKADTEGKLARETLTTIAKSSKEARINLSRQSELILVSGQLRNTLFGLSLAKKGLWEHIDTLVRDPLIAPRVKVTIVNGSATDLLTREFPNHPRTGQYIDRLIEKESKTQALPKVTLYEFTRDLFDDGIDPVAPIVKGSDLNAVIDGVAIFNEDRYVMKIDPKEALFFALLRDDFQQGQLSLDLPSKGGDQKDLAMFSNVIGNRHVKVHKQGNGKFAVDIKITVQGSLLEYIGKLDLSDDKAKHELESRMSEYISKQAEAIIKKIQKNKADSIGIGTYVRNSMSYKQWKEMDWRKVYPQVEVHCSTKIKIKDYGKFK
jgi:spore germination protein